MLSALLIITFQSSHSPFEMAWITSKYHTGIKRAFPSSPLSRRNTFPGVLNLSLRGLWGLWEHTPLGMWLPAQGWLRDRAALPAPFLQEAWKGGPGQPKLLSQPWPPLAPGRWLMPRAGSAQAAPCPTLSLAGALGHDRLWETPQPMQCIYREREKFHHK